MLGDAAPGQREHVLAVHLGGGAHAQLAQDAAVVVEQDVRVRAIQRAVRIEFIEARRHHLQFVGGSLELAVAAGLAGRAEVVALDEQHLHQRAAQAVQFLAIAFHFQSRLGRHGAGGHGAAADFDGAQLATAVRLEFRVVAQVRDVTPGSQRRLHHRLSGFEGNGSTVELKGGSIFHDPEKPGWWVGRCEFIRI